MYEIGVIGCGRISKVYQAAFQNLKDQVHVRFCVDKHIDRARAFAHQFEGCGYGDDLGELLKTKLDTVHVLTPHFLHKEHVIRCLEAGFHVLTEKPIAIYVADGEEMIRTAQRCERQLGVIFQNRYITGIVEAKRLIEQGVLGKLIGAWSQLNWWRPESYYECDWKGTWEMEGGGVVIDQAIHSLDLVRYLAGCPVTSVKANIDRRVLTSIEVEDVADAVIRFENGMIYSFFASNYYTHNSPIRVEISGEKGTILLTGDSVEIHIDGQTPRVVEMATQLQAEGENYWGSCHQTQIISFYQALSENRPVPTDPKDALETLKLVQAIYTSAKENRVVTLENFNE
ncbi:MAG: Gfo/Idh/MocA family oxidoreductase [Clostridia bacterium]